MIEESLTDKMHNYISASYFLLLNKKYRKLEYMHNFMKKINSPLLNQNICLESSPQILLDNSINDICEFQKNKNKKFYSEKKLVDTSFKKEEIENINDIINSIVEIKDLSDTQKTEINLFETDIENDIFSNKNIKKNNFFQEQKINIKQKFFKNNMKK